MDFDDVLDELGEFGPYQAKYYFLVCLPVFFAAANSLSYVFTAGIPDYRCFVPGCDSETNSDLNAPWVRDAIPPSSSYEGSKEYVPSQCLRYQPQQDNLNGTCPSMFTTNTLQCDRWIFSNEQTIVQEWNITCPENQWMLSLVGTSHFAGIVVGSAWFGFLADKFGRKNIFVFTILLMAVSGVLQAVSTNYIMFQTFVFINALGTSGVFPLAFIIGVELVGRNKREMTCIVLNYFYAIGEAIVALIAWLTLDWVWIQVIVSAPAAVFIIYFWVIPESVRWLLAHRKNSEASSIITKAAEVNGVVLSSHLLSSLDSPTITQIENINLDIKDKPKNFNTMGETFIEICKTPKLLFRSLNMFYNWAANAIVYYGLSVNSTSLGGNKYLNFALVCLVEIPGYTISWVAMNRLGRRWALAGALFICSGTCLAAAFVPPDMEWLVIVLFLVGKIGITSSFGVLYVYTAELYPTVMRSAGVGASSTFARVGAMLAPFAPLLATYNQAFPFIVFGAVSLIAGLLTLLFPETLGVKLPETTEEIKML